MIIKMFGLILFFSLSESKNHLMHNLPMVNNNRFDLLNIIQFFTMIISDVHNLYFDFFVSISVDYNNYYEYYSYYRENIVWSMIKYISVHQQKTIQFNLICI